MFTDDHSFALTVLAQSPFTEETLSTPCFEWFFTMFTGATHVFRNVALWSTLVVVMFLAVKTIVLAAYAGYVVVV